MSKTKSSPRRCVAASKPASEGTSTEPPSDKNTGALHLSELERAPPSVTVSMLKGKAVARVEALEACLLDLLPLTLEALEMPEIPSHGCLLQLDEGDADVRTAAAHALAMAVRERLAPRDRRDIYHDRSSGVSVEISWHQDCSEGRVWLSFPPACLSPFVISAANVMKFSEAIQRAAEKARDYLATSVHPLESEGLYDEAGAPKVTWCAGHHDACVLLRDRREGRVTIPAKQVESFAKGMQKAERMAEAWLAAVHMPRIPDPRREPLSEHVGGYKVRLSLAATCEEERPKRDPYDKPDGGILPVQGPKQRTRAAR